METRELTCIGCPMGCQLKVEIENGEVRTVTGNTCKIGEQYAHKEVTDPRRIVTSTVRVTGAKDIDRVSVKTATDVPKAKIFDVMAAINAATVKAPVTIGDVLLQDVAGTGADVVATAHAKAG